MDEPLSNLDAKLRVQTRTAGLAAAEAARHHDGLRDPRPDRGHDAGRPAGRDAQRPAPAGGHPAGALRPAGQPVRGRVHRLAGDELHGRHAGGGRAADPASATCRFRRALRQELESANVGREVIVGLRPEDFEDAALVPAENQQFGYHLPRRRSTWWSRWARTSSSTSPRTVTCRPTPTSSPTWPRTSGTSRHRGRRRAGHGPAGRRDPDPRGRERRAVGGPAADARVRPASRAGTWRWRRAPTARAADAGLTVMPPCPAGTGVPAGHGGAVPGAPGGSATARSGGDVSGRRWRARPGRARAAPPRRR